MNGFEEFPYLAALAGGFLSFLSPCVLPLVPGYLSYIAGVSAEEAFSDDKKIRNKILFKALLFVIGFSFIFISMGAGAASLSIFLQEYQNILTKIAGAFIIIIGLHVAGLFRLSFLYREIRVNPEIAEVRGIFAPLLLGAAFGLGWTPCIGPILAGILVLATSQETVAQGAALLSVYSIGLGIPFLLSAFALSKFQRVTSGVKKKFAVIEKIAGGLLIITGFFIFTGELQSFGTLLIDTFPFLTKLG